MATDLFLEMAELPATGSLGTGQLDTRDLLVAGVPISISSKYLYLYLELSGCSVNPFPAVYEFILVFPSAANKYICFIFLIPSPPATNIFVETINAPAHAHNSNCHFQRLEYFQQFEIYCILRLFSTFTSILVRIIYIFNF